MSTKQTHRFFRTRFAPSPTGHLHIGHALAAWKVWKDAEQNKENVSLRIEDIDRTRCKPEFEESILRDLAWLGLEWQQPVRRQSDHFDDYQMLLNRLEERGLLYPCFCTRKDLGEEDIYPGTCRNLNKSQQQDMIASGKPYALRLDLTEALHQTDYKNLLWHDRAKGPQTTTQTLLEQTIGDVVLARKDTPASYHLCVTHDDALQEITLITRGDDLFFATHCHRLLQELLDYPVPEYHHHSLITDRNGKKFSKKDKSLTIQFVRNKGFQPEDLRRMIDTGNFDQLLS